MGETYQPIEADDFEARREQREFELIEKRHEIAVAAFRFEKVLFSMGAERSAAEEAKLAEFYESVPEEAAQMFWQAGENYRQRLMDHAKNEAEMHETLEKFHDAGIKIEEQLDEFWGKHMFRNATAEQPKDKVTFVSQEGYFLMKFSNSEDYVNFRKNSDSSSNTPEGIERIKNSGGCHYTTLHLPHFKDKFVGPVLLINGEESQDSVITHERQHFINHALLRKFNVSEAGSVLAQSEQDLGEAKLRSIKDEVIAYTRDGSDGSSIINLETSPLYTRLEGTPNLVSSFLPV